MFEYDDLTMHGVLIADMQHWRDVLRISFICTVGSKYLLNKKCLPSLVLLTDNLNVLGWTLSSEGCGSSITLEEENISTPPNKDGRVAPPKRGERRKNADEG